MRVNGCRCPSFRPPPAYSPPHPPRSARSAAPLRRTATSRRCRRRPTAWLPRCRLASRGCGRADLLPTHVTALKVRRRSGGGWLQLSVSSLPPSAASLYPLPHQHREPPHTSVTLLLPTFPLSKLGPTHDAQFDAARGRLQCKIWQQHSSRVADVSILRSEMSGVGRSALCVARHGGWAAGGLPRIGGTARLIQFRRAFLHTTWSRSSTWRPCDTPPSTSCAPTRRPCSSWPAPGCSPCTPACTSSTATSRFAAPRCSRWPGRRGRGAPPPCCTSPPPACCRRPAAAVGVTSCTSTSTASSTWPACSS